MERNSYDNMTISLLSRGDSLKYSHMIIVNTSENIDILPIFIKRNEDIKEKLSNIYNNSNYEVKEIYNYDINLNEQIAETRAYHINTDYNKMNRAYKLAKEKHEGQTRLDGSPYISHPIRVAEIVGKYFYDHPRINELITAAYLHDVIEDTNTTEEDIKEEFGEYVAHLVKGVTTNQNDKQKMGKTNYLCNKMLNMDEDVLRLKLCDRLANVFDLENASSEFIDKYSAETLIIINYLLNNREMNTRMREIIKSISIQINNLRNNKILELINDKKLFNKVLNPR